MGFTPVDSNGATRSLGTNNFTELQGEFVSLGALNDNTGGPQKFIPATATSDPVYGKKKKRRRGLFSSSGGDVEEEAEYTEEEQEAAKAEALRRNVTQTKTLKTPPGVVFLNKFREFEYAVIESSDPKLVMEAGLAR